jgi:hypothetical protein
VGPSRPTSGFFVVSLAVRPQVTLYNKNVRAVSPSNGSGDLAVSQVVDSIVQQIERLDEADRILLEEKLRDLAEVQWQEGAKEARAVARERGIDQQAIDNAVENVRYGS